MKYPAIPCKDVSVEEELEYIFKTDQRDRIQNMHRIIFMPGKHDSNKKILAISDRDSLRLVRVMAFDRDGLLKSDREKYLAAWIYLHAGGRNMKDNLSSWQRCHSLANEIQQSTSSKKYIRRSEFLMEESNKRIEDWNN